MPKLNRPTGGSQAKLLSLNPHIIVFDVDNTLIRGNLTIFLLKFLATKDILFNKKLSIIRRMYLLVRSLSVLTKGAFLLLWRLPRSTKNILIKSRNVHKLDRYIKGVIKNFYQSIFILLKELNLLEKSLHEKATELFTDDFLEKHTYVTGIETIKKHLEDENNVVVLLSGSPQELLDVFYAYACKKLPQNLHNRFLAQGTVLKPRIKSILPCVGSEKSKALKRLLAQKKLKNYTITYIYSDNTFMADLPLLIESKHGGTLISKRSNLYKLLPKKLIQSFIFMPLWQKD